MNCLIKIIKNWYIFPVETVVSAAIGYEQEAKGLLEEK